MNQKVETDLGDALTLDFQPPEMGEMYFCYELPTSYCFVETAEKDKNNYIH